MRQLLSFLLLSLMLPCALSQQISPQPKPLTDDEKRQIWEFLADYKNLITDQASYKAEVQRLLAADEQQQIEYLKRIEQEKTNAALAKQQADLAQQQIDFYKTSLKVCQNAGKRGIGCWLKKIFTAFVAHC